MRVSFIIVALLLVVCFASVAVQGTYSSLSMNNDEESFVPPGSAEKHIRTRTLPRKLTSSPNDRLIKHLNSIVKRGKKIHKALAQHNQEQLLSESMGSQSGKASYYSNSYNGRTTSNGEIFSNTASTCAHKTLAFGTIVTVTNVSNGKSATCRVNDRGPFITGRIIDLTSHVFSQLAPLSQGLVDVEIHY